MHGQHLDAYVIGAGVAMFGDTLRDRAFVAPRDDRVDEAVASAVGEVVVGEAEPTPVVPVVGKRRGRWRARRARRCRASSASVLSTTDCSTARILSAPMTRARRRGVLGRAWYGCAPSARSAESASIFGPSAASTRRGGVGRLHGEEQRRVHVVEVVPHRRERRPVRRLAHPLDRGLVAHTDAEHEPSGKRLFDGAPRRVRASSRRARRAGTMPVATTSVVVAPRSSVECTIASRFTASGIQSAP